MLYANWSHQQRVNIVWFKRDLRLRDHVPLAMAIRSGKPVILLYVVEPSLISDPHYDLRHWRFILESLNDLQYQLKPYNATLQVAYGEVIDVLQSMASQYAIETMLSYEEVGVATTFKRDIAVAQWCKQQGVAWKESPAGAVQRGLSHRLNWDANWKAAMLDDCDHPNLGQLQTITPSLPTFKPPQSWLTPHPLFQRGGAMMANRTLASFLQERGQHYMLGISKPHASRRACSRMSPYLAWGNISLRDMYQQLLTHWQKPGWQRSVSGLSSRLHWHCHFIQKFESECRMEFEHVNRAYDDFEYDESKESAALLAQWESGETGFPLVDACMKCLQATGFTAFAQASHPPTLVGYPLGQHRVWL